MSQQIYNYTKHTLPGGGKDVLNKLRTFLVGEGWTQEDYQTSVVWGSDGGGGYQWNAGNDDFLQMVSYGYGGQTLRVRIYVEYDSGYLNQFKWYLTMVDPTVAGAPDSGSATTPVNQNRMGNRTYYNWMSVPSSTFNEVYLIGNDKYCCVVFRCTSTVVIQSSFGLPELLPEYRGYDLSYGPPGASRTSSHYYWDEIDAGLDHDKFFYPFINSSSFDFMWLGDESYDTAKFRNNTSIGTGANDATLAERWNNMEDIIYVNAYTGKRVLFQPQMFIKNDSDQWEFIGHHPCHVLQGTGISIAEILKYGVDEYLTFPICAFGKPWAFAMRVA